MKSLFALKSLLLVTLLLAIETANAGLYIDGGLSYRRIDNVNGSGSSDTISITDVIVGYKDKLDLPFGLGTENDTYNIRGQYRRASYSSFQDNNYTEWLGAGDFRLYLSRRWWLQFSGEYLLVDPENTNDGLDRLSLGVKNGYRIIPDLLLTQGLRYRNTTFDSSNESNITYGYSIGAKYDFSDFFSAFADYAVDEDYLDNVGIFAAGTELTTIKAGIILGINDKSALRLSYESIDDGSTKDSVFSSDFVLRY